MRIDAAWSADDNTSFLLDTNKIRLSSRSPAIKVIRQGTGILQTRDAIDTPAPEKSPPINGGTCNSMNLSVLLYHNSTVKGSQTQINQLGDRWHHCHTEVVQHLQPPAYDKNLFYIDFKGTWLTVMSSNHTVSLMCTKARHK